MFLACLNQKQVPNGSPKIPSGGPRPRQNRLQTGLQKYLLGGRAQGKSASLEAATAADCSEKFRKSSRNGPQKIKNEKMVRNKI